MPFIGDRFVTRTQILIEAGELPPRCKIPANVYERNIFRTRACKLGYTYLDARLFGNPAHRDTWKAVLEAHDTGNSLLSRAECDARKDAAIEATKVAAVQRRDREEKARVRKEEAREKKKLLEAEREAKIAASFDEAHRSEEILVTYWIDNRNGIVLYQKPTAIQGLRFYTQLKNKAALNGYLTHAASHGKAEAVAIYGDRGKLIGTLMTPEVEDYEVKNTSDRFPNLKCEQFKRPKEWTEKLTRRELLASNHCLPRDFDRLPDGGCFCDSLGRRWWKVVSPRQFAFDESVRQRGQSRERVMYCR